MSLKANLCSRFSAIGLKQIVVHQLVDEIAKWHSNNGSEWTVKRLKDLKQYYLKSLANEKYEPSIWVARSRNKIKGPFGYLIHSRKLNRARVLNALNAYTYFVSREPTKTQLKKFITSTLASPVEPMPEKPKADGVDEAATQLRFTMDIVLNRGRSRITPKPVPHRGGSKKLALPKHWSTFAWSPSKRAPLSLTDKTVPESSVEDWMPDNCQGLLDLARKSVDYPVLEAAGVLKFELHSHLTRPKHIQSLPTTRKWGGGRVSFLQEPGFKLRAVANPYRLWQVLLEPLKVSLMETLEKIPTDCTHDQTRGVNQVQKWLQDGHTVYSVDLSDATNRAPLSQQMALLYKVYNLGDRTTEGILDLFSSISRETWRLPDGRPISWTKGQPLGLGPSFASFALWHNSVLHDLRKEVGGDFVVLGDDVCIRHEALYVRYRETLTRLDMPVSESKCFTSKGVAEFAGKIITPEKVYSVGKWREISDANFVDIASSLGPQSISMFRPRQRKVLRVIGPLPEFVGGCGWNRKGESLTERIQRAIDMGFLDNKDDELVDFRSTSNATLTVLNKIRYEKHNGEVREEDLVPPIPPRDRYNATLFRLGVTRGTTSEKLDGDFVASVPKSDPHRTDQLVRLEKQIQRSTDRLILDHDCPKLDDQSESEQFSP